jgi:hypothetical protein
VDIAGVREAMHRQPFEPFEIRLADGCSLPIHHPDFVAVGRRRIVVVNEADDATSMIEPLLIVSIDTITKKRRGGNGSPRRRGGDS